jgi:transcriptional regulator with XRE-family HTH domain
MGELGQRLVRAREARGLTLEDAERDTRISRRYLEALESEQFEVIPAPVYARGFLRSYSQYLGLDPQQTVALFPRDDGLAVPQPARPSMQTPLSPVGPARPTWRRAEQPPAARPPVIGGPASREPAGAQATPSPSPEPTIGIDIGVPSPTRRINPNPPTQGRTLLIIAVAGGAILAMILLAIIIRAAGGNGSGAGANPDSTPSATGAAEEPTPTTSASSGLTVTPGVVPDLRGQQAAVARLAIQEAGYEVNEQRAKNSATRGTVFEQSPAPGTQLAQGQTVIIVVSDGP